MRQSDDEPDARPESEDTVSDETPDETTNRITDDERNNRYELRVDGERVGFAAYRREEGRITFTHTVVDPAHEGHGYGGAIARQAVADAVRRGDTIVPRCPFIRSWLEKHPDAATDIDWPDHP